MQNNIIGSTEGDLPEYFRSIYFLIQQIQRKALMYYKHYKKKALHTIKNADFVVILLTSQSECFLLSADSSGPVNLQNVFVIDKPLQH